MVYVFTIWAIPLVLFWGWYFLSYYDINFGYLMLSREGNELVFNIYGQILGIDPATIPWLLAKACVLDTLIILAIWAFRRRKKIVAWWSDRQSGYSV